MSWQHTQLRRSPALPAAISSRSLKTLSLRISYRLCTAANLDALEWHGLFSHDRPILRAAYRRQQRGVNLMLLAILNATPVGQVWIDLEKLRTPRVGWIWAVRVIPWLHGLGIGTDLMLHAENLAHSEKLAALELSVHTRNDRARRFYERLGYERTNHRPASQFPGHWLMRKKLIPISPPGVGAAVSNYPRQDRTPAVQEADVAA